MARKPLATVLTTNTMEPAALPANATEVQPEEELLWYRGKNCNFNPRVQDMADVQAIERYVLAGWTPSEPKIGPETKVVAFGSCFAANIANWLAARDFNILTKEGGSSESAYIVRFGDAMVNSFVIRQQFEWAFENKKFAKDIWHDKDAMSFAADEGIRLRTRELFDQAEVFIITFGLSEIWYDEPSGDVFWRAVPADKHDPERHKFRVSTVAENKENIHAILNLLKRYRPEATVILTLSPIPLMATFRPVSCVGANSASKAILKSALDETLRERGESNVYYWPSYEIIMDGFQNRWVLDRRHVKKEILEYVMLLFERYWCYGTATTSTTSEALMRALAATAALPANIAEALCDGTVAPVDRWLNSGREKPPETLDMVASRLRELLKERNDSEIGALLESLLPQLPNWDELRLSRVQRNLDRKARIRNPS